MQWRNDTTLPSRGLGLRPIGKSSECFRMTTGVKSGKAQNERMFYRFAPEIGHPICTSTSTNYLSIGFAKRLRGHGPQQGATPGAAHPVWGTSAEFPCRAAARRTRLRAEGLPNPLKPPSRPLQPI